MKTTICGDDLAIYELIDARLRRWALGAGCEEQRYNCLIGDGVLRRAGYHEAFPHLLMAPVVASHPECSFEQGNIQLAGSFLSPAVCYHTYAFLKGTRIPKGGRLFTARGRCFRNEAVEELIPGRRQTEFEMRELILVGNPAWLEERLHILETSLQNLIDEFGFSHAQWLPASDPFFLPAAQGKAHMQKLLGTKLELCLPDGLAVASINRHRAFFGDRFDITVDDGSPAHTACIAFGLDRIAAQAGKANSIE